jgi:SAM-dependent methyltransferase
MASPTILNLGAGNRPIGNAVNHDLTKHRPEIAVTWDLNTLPWPWADRSFELIVARAVLEHLRIDLVQSLNECWRLLRPGGQLFIKLPYWQSDVSHQDPTHRWFFSLHSLDQFDPETTRGRAYAFYTPRKWKIREAPQLNHSSSSIIATLEVRK